MPLYYQAPYRLQLSLPDALRDRLRVIVRCEHTTQQHLLVQWIEEKIVAYEHAHGTPSMATPEKEGC